MRHLTDVPGSVLAGVAALAGVFVAMDAWAQQPSAPAGSDPFAQSQLAELAPPAGVGVGGLQLAVSGFVDAGYIYITQTGPKEDGGDLSWAYGNSQFTFFSQNSTFALNEVDLTIDAEREGDGVRYGARASIDFYPSRDTEAYSISGSDREWDVDQGFVFLEWSNWWKTRVVLGRAPGFVTLEQLEADSPELRLIGHTYVFQAGGGYPYGLQLTTRPLDGLAIKLGLANGGIGAYSFFPGDTSTLNRPVARDADNSTNRDEVDGRTGYGAIDWIVFDRAAGIGTLRLGVAGASASELTYNVEKQQEEPYSFGNAWIGYRVGSVEAKLEAASLDAFYEQSLGHFEADMAYLLLSVYLGSDHLVTLRGERMTFVSDRDPDIEGKATKYGLTYRYRVGDGFVIKLEAVREEQVPQFWTLSTEQNLTTDVVSTSWVYAF